MSASDSTTLTIVIDEAKLETGLWCQRCQLPSGYRVPVLTLTLAGVGPIGTIARCLDGDHVLEPR